MTFNNKKSARKNKKAFVGPCPTDAELRSLEAKIPNIKNEEEDKAIRALLPFPDLTRKA